MEQDNRKKWIWLAGILVGLWLGIRYLLPMLFPFLLGLLLALAAEPLVRLVSRKLRRPWAAGIGVGSTLVLCVCILTLLGALAVKELSILSQKLPDVQVTAQKGITRLRDWLDGVVQRTPEGVQGLLGNVVDGAFSKRSTLLEPVADKIPQKVTDLVLWLPQGVVTLFTALVSAFMISARLPKLRQKLRSWLPESWQEKYLPLLGHMRAGLWGWLKAQLKLMAITWGIVSAGLVVLRVDYGIFLAALIALVDAVPVLGTGTVLVPWAVVALLQGNRALALGLLGIYGVAVTVRTVLEPRLVGRHLGIDPLVTLVAFYVGFTLWGFLGMLLAPLLVACFSAVRIQEKI